MRNLIYLFAILIILPSCKKDDPKPKTTPELIVGTWVCYDTWTSGDTLVIRAGGGGDHYPTQKADPTRLDWSLKDNDTYFECAGVSASGLVRFNRVGPIAKINETEFWFGDNAGYKYTRLK